VTAVRADLDPVPAPPVMALESAADRPGYAVAKRELDFAVSLVALVALLPILAIIALAIAIDSAGPVLFRQERVGARRRRDGRWELRTFRMLKFRTMADGADRSGLHVAFVEAYVTGSLDGAPESMPFKLAGDPRVTRVGRAQRATRLDELPQLVNVLTGRMSLVGPRPVPVYEVALYEDRHFARLAGLPGLTGPWQVDGRGTASFEEMVELDARYLRCQSLWLDIKLLLRTVPCIVRRRSAR
jgi:exopolysaccharide production protein ExoY